MPITMPTEFEQNRLKTGAVNTMIVLFMDASGSGVEHVASTMGMQQGSLFVHSHLVSVSSINEKLDLSTKSWGTSDVTIKLLNPRYVQGAAGEKDRLSEATDPEWGGTILDWALVKIYLLSGSTNTSLTSDGILRFSGRIIQTPTVTEQTITVKAISVEKEKHKMLPTTLVGSTYSSAPAENLEQPIPIVYGQFNQNFWGDIAFDDGSFTGFGLAKALVTEEEKNPKYVLSDHVIDAITGRFYDLGSGLLFEGRGGGGSNVNDSGHGTVTGGTYVRQNFHLNDDVPSEYTSYLKVMVNKANVHDGNTGTKGTLRNNYTFTGQEDTGRGFFGINNQLAFREVFWRVASGDNIPVFSVYLYNAEWTGTEAEVSGADIHDDSVFELYYGAADERLSTPTGSGGGTLKGLLDDEDFFSIFLGDRDDATFNEEQPLALALYVKVTPGSNLTINSLELLHLTEAYIEARVDITVQPVGLWVECRGREYLSWITASGRSINSQVSGNLIENPASIIEDILRSELGAGTGDIDIDSFDDAYDEDTDLANRQARLNITKPISSEKVIKGLAEQSTFAFTWTAAGKAKLVPLHSSYWSGKDIDATIKWSHIKFGSLKLSKTKIYCNEVKVKSRWQGESGLFRDTDTTTDSGSRSSYGEWDRSATWPSIAGDTQGHVSAKYVNSSDGLWSQPHLQVQLETLVFTYAHLEIGDAIELDSVSCDPQLKAYGESWSGIKLCVVGLQQNLSGTKITAVELFG